MIKRIVLFLLCVVAALAFAGFHQWKTAEAAKIYDPQCGKTAGKFVNAVNISFQSDGFHVVWQQNCGYSPDNSVEVELQRNENGTGYHTVKYGGNQSANDLFGTPQSIANDTVLRTSVFGASCGSGNYRVKVYGYDTSDSSVGFNPC